MKRCFLGPIAFCAVAVLVGAGWGNWRSITLEIPPANAETRPLLLASTTSTENSGLLAHLLPIFEAQTGININTVAVGTGRALQLGRLGDVDVLLVHHPASEEAFVAAGYGVYRHSIMYNDYIIVGPQDDPAGVRDAGTIAQAMRQLAQGEGVFLSRGDDSGTHKKELSLWQQAGVNLDAHSQQWRRETGSGMGATLNTAHGLRAYTLSDRSSWTAFGNREDMAILYEGDFSLRNPYGVILINPARHPHILEAEGRAFIDWLVSPTGQNAIAGFRLDGEQLFFPSHAVSPLSLSRETKAEKRTLASDAGLDAAIIVEPESPQ